jgi:hypothetical protein
VARADRAFYVLSRSAAQREEKGITPQAERARQSLKTRKVRSALPRAGAPGFLFAVRAAAADGRDPAAVTAGYSSCSRGARTTPRPQESGRQSIAVEAGNRPCQKGSPPTAPPPHGPHPCRTHCTVRTPAAPPPHPRRTVRILTASPPLGPHPGRAAGRAQSAAPGVGWGGAAGGGVDCLIRAAGRLNPCL